MVGIDNNVFLGEAGNDFLDGGDGNDLLVGSTGDGTLLGYAGDDLLEGEGESEAKDNILYAGFGSDTTYISEEDDILYGGLKADTRHDNSERDLFILTATKSLGIVANFAAVQDLVKLPGGLAFNRLSIAQNMGSNENDFFSPIRNIEFGADTVFGNKLF